MTKKLTKLLISLCLCTVCAVCAFGFTACGNNSNAKYTSCNGGTAYALSRYEGSAATFEIPAQYNGLPVVAISDQAFYASAYLTSVTIPDSVTSIGDKVFIDCWSLKNLTIPDSVTSIGANLSNSPMLKKITFNGTSSQWENISKHILWKSNSAITNIICTDRTITL